MFYGEVHGGSVVQQSDEDISCLRTTVSVADSVNVHLVQPPIHSDRHSPHSTSWWKDAYVSSDTDVTSIFWRNPTRSVSLLQQNMVTTVETCCIIHGKVCCNSSMQRFLATRAHRCNNLLQHKQPFCCNNCCNASPSVSIV